MNTTTLLAGLMLASTLPAFADAVAISTKPNVMYFRDSDGIVISVIHPIDYYSPFPGGTTGGPVIYTMGGVAVEFSGGPDVTMTAGGLGPFAAGAIAPTAVVNGTTYKVEVSGNDVWLRDPVTGVRLATERRMAAVLGAKVNPNSFAMD